MKKLNKKGFTLVELIVVIVIIGVLALIAVPVFSGYITKANDTAKDAEARSVYLAAQVVVAEKDYETADISDAIKKDIADMAGVEITTEKPLTITVTDGAVSITYNGVTMPK